MMDLNRVSQVTGGQHYGANAIFSSLVNDTRQDCSNKLYVAIQGPNFDGHDYIDMACDKGASGILAEKEIKLKNDIPIIRVDDSIKAMGQIAAAWRNEFDIPVLGITGSAGKTTLKELAGSILSVSLQGTVTKGNLNNHIGVPLTLSRITAEDDFSVVEMGMNHSGEIRYLSKMVSPTVAIINNAAAAHLDELGSIEAVAYAKGEIIEGLAKGGVQILNADDQYCSLWQALAQDKRQITFGLNEKSDITAKFEATATGSTIHVEGCYGEFTASINLPGEHNVRNALAVIAATLEMGCSIKDVQLGLSQYHALANRGGVHVFDSMVLIDDSYNANPTSMQAAFDVLALHIQQARKEFTSVQSCVVLGDMAELGQQIIVLHEQVGSAAKKVANKLFCFGKQQKNYLSGFGDGSFGFDGVQDLVSALLEEIEHSNGGQDKTFHLILVKGSRSSGMEKVVEQIVNYQQKKSQEEG